MILVPTVMALLLAPGTEVPSGRFDGPDYIKSAYHVTCQNGQYSLEFAQTRGEPTATGVFIGTTITPSATGVKLLKFRPPKKAASDNLKSALHRALNEFVSISTVWFVCGYDAKEESSRFIDISVKGSLRTMPPKEAYEACERQNLYWDWESLRTIRIEGENAVVEGTEMGMCIDSLPLPEFILQTPR